MNTRNTALAIAIGLTLSACNGGDSSSNSGSTTPAVKTSSILVIDGVWENAKVCIDSNKDGLCGGDEKSAITDKDGIVTFNDTDLEGANLIATIEAGVSIDADRGMATKGQQYFAKHGEEVLSPWSTLAANIDSENPYETIFSSFDQVGSVEELVEMSSKNWTDGSTMQHKRFIAASEALNDLQRDIDASHASVMAILPSLDDAIGQLDENEIDDFAPTFDLTDDVLTLQTNMKPIAKGTIKEQTLTYEGESITDVPLIPLFEDVDGDPLSFSMTPSVEGLSITNDILSGTPVAGSHTIYITATDGKTSSDPIEFKLTALGEEKPTPKLKTVINYSKILDSKADATKYIPYKDTLLTLDYEEGTVFLQTLKEDGTWTQGSLELKPKYVTVSGTYTPTFVLDANANIYARFVGKPVSGDSDENKTETYYIDMSDVNSPSAKLFEKELSTLACSDYKLHNYYCESGKGYYFTATDLYDGSYDIEVYKKPTDEYVVETRIDIKVPALDGTFIKMTPVSHKVNQATYNSKYNMITLFIHYSDEFDGKEYRGIALYNYSLDTHQAKLSHFTVERNEQRRFWDYIVYSSPDGITVANGDNVINYHYNTDAFTLEKMELKDVDKLWASDIDWSFAIPKDFEGNHILVREKFYGDYDTYLFNPVYE